MSEPLWIPVEERLPAVGLHVLVRLQCGEGAVAAAMYHVPGNRCWTTTVGYEDFDEQRITHWMPLPEPPEVK